MLILQRAKHWSLLLQTDRTIFHQFPHKDIDSICKRDMVESEVSTRKNEALPENGFLFRLVIFQPPYISYASTMMK